MKQNNKVCNREGHVEIPIFHICTLQGCNQPKRWCCSECISLGIHNHDKPNNSHIMKINELFIKLQNQQENFKEDQDSNKTKQILINLEQIVKKCQDLEKIIRDYRQSIESQIFMTQQQAEIKLNFNNLDLNLFEQLDDIEINKLLQINLQPWNKNQQILPFDKMIQQLYSIESIIKEQQEKQNNICSKFIDLKNRKYIMQEIDKTNNRYFGSSLSKNEQYLAYGAYNDKLLKIYNLNSKKIIKEINLDSFLLVCQFTQNSSQLYVGLSEGYVCGYEVEGDFKKIYVQQIHSSSIYNIITIYNQYLITCSDDKSIIKTDIKRSKIIFKLTSHTDYIIAIDYNDKDDIIVSGSGDKSIKLWNCRNQSLMIDKQQSHNNWISQIQFINNYLNILSLDLDGNLYKWEIDLVNKELIKVQQFSDLNNIFNFQQVNSDQNLLIICNSYVKILNQQGKTLNILQHSGQDSTLFDCRQLDNLNYIQIRTWDKILLAIAQD